MSKTKPSLKNMAFIAVSAAFISIFAPFSFPLGISPVPITLATFAIYICSAVLGAKKAVAAVLIYIMTGIVGLPVFSGFSGGFEKLIGPTGGYIIGYLFCAFTVGYFCNKFEKNLLMYILGMTLGTLLCYIFGTFWLMYQSNLSFISAVSVAVIPFLIGDIIKIIFASILSLNIKKAILKF